MAVKKMMRRRPAMPPEAMPPAAMPPTAPMKKGGEVGSKSVGKKLSMHEGMPASKAHKGLKTGGVAKSTKPGEYKTGGVVDGQGGYKNGGTIKFRPANTTKVSTAHANTNSAPTGSVKMGNAGGYKHGGAAMMHGGTTMKKGGSAKMHFAMGGAVAMPKKAMSQPVATNQQSGTFKRGGKVNADEC
jgi:hypothetical protein